MLHLRDRGLGGDVDAAVRAFRCYLGIKRPNGSSINSWQLSLVPDLCEPIGNEWPDLLTAVFDRVDHAHQRPEHNEIYLPDGDGIAFVAEIDLDAFMISAASDSATVRRALRAGALDYLIKPFEPAQLSERLEAYRRFRTLAAEDRQLDQDAIERAQRVLHGRDGGLASVSRSTTEKLLIELLQDGESSATLIAGRAGLSRATAQRHLAALATRGDVDVTLRYGSTGRPEHQCSMRR